VKIRPAEERDLDAMVEVMLAEPSVEQVAFMPSLAGARRFARALWSNAGPEDFIVADDDGEVVGFAWCSQTSVGLREGARAAVAGWGLLGPIRLVIKGWPRQFVEIPMPPGLKLIELQVDPSRRGSGIGSMLLEHVIAAADDGSLSLTTRSDNPAQRLYERHGFAIAAHKSHRFFQRRTGADGRILMVRPASSTSS